MASPLASARLYARQAPFPRPRARPAPVDDPSGRPLARASALAGDDLSRAESEKERKPLYGRRRGQEGARWPAAGEHALKN